jgi:hypothetical protein
MHFSKTGSFYFAKTGNYHVAVTLFQIRMSRRDDLEGDWIEVQLDSYFDHRTAFGFMVNAAGVK